jgi:hypothetical protein
MRAFEDGLGEMNVHRGKVHKYLGTSLDFSHKRQCHVTMYDYLDGILEAFCEAVKKQGEGYITVKKRHCVKTAASDNLFVVNKDCKKLSLGIATTFRTILAKTLYVTKQVRPDTCLNIAFLLMRVRAPDTDDLRKVMLSDGLLERGARLTSCSKC